MSAESQKPTKKVTVKKKATGTKSVWDAKVVVVSGLFSRSVSRFQDGMREIAKGINGAYFHVTETGFSDYKDCAAHLIKKKRKSVVFITHSNGGYFATRVAKLVEPYGIKCYIFSIDRTAKPCPTVGSNVPQLVNVDAGLRKIVTNERFTGVVVDLDYTFESHVGVTYNKDVQRLAIAFAKEWK